MYRNEFTLNPTILLLSIFGILLSAPVAGSAQDTGSLDSAKQNQIEQELERILAEQARCWNEKDIEGFMQTYWKSDQLTFSGGGKTVRGWQATLQRYKAKYPPEKMGRLSFDHLETTLLSEGAALVLGQWHLSYDDDKADGNFSLVLRKINSKWKIIHDHSSTLEKE
jgi:ketosteroid isomerase-like protein